MTQSDYIENLKTILAQIEKSEKWLLHSYKECESYNFENLTPQNYDQIEAFNARFARTSDLLFQKLFRSIDAIEFENKGTLLDALNRAEKRGIIEKVDHVREIREIRNTIAHDYAAENIISLTKEALDVTPTLLKILKNTQSYCQKFL
jgi:hypothetical protein